MGSAFYRVMELLRKVFGVRKEFFETSGRRVLDVGSGDHARGNICLDRDLLSNPDVSGEATELPFGDAVLDEVVCYHLVEHLEPSETKRLFAEVRRVLVPGGSAHFLVDRDIDEESLFRKDPAHVRRYDVEFIRKLAEEYYEIEIFQTRNWIGNVNKFGVMSWWYLNQATKIYLEVRKGRT